MEQIRVDVGKIERDTAGNKQERYDEVSDECCNLRAVPGMISGKRTCKHSHTRLSFDTSAEHSHSTKYFVCVESFLKVCNVFMMVVGVP